jgi:predicted Zn-dependent peptidase
MRKAALILIILLITIPVFARGKTVLDNGVKFIEIERPYTNTLSVVMFVKGGTSRENPENNGIGSLFSSVWVKSSELLKEVEFYGGSVNASLGSDFMETSFSIPSEHFEKLIGSYEELLLNPVVDKEVFQREKLLQKEEIKAINDNPNAKVFKQFMKATYGDHPYGLSSEGTLETVDSFEISDLKKYADALIQGKNITVAVAGNYTKKQLDRIKTVFGKIKAGEPFILSCGAGAVKKEERIEDTDKNIEQAKLFIGYTAPSASEKDYAAVKVISDILGGGMSSRYFNVLRKDKGYAYSVGAAYPSKICKSRFIAHIGLQYENVEDAIATMEKINKEFINDLTDEELESVKNYMLGKILIDSQTNSKQAWYACFFENAGLGSEFFSNYINILKGISKDDVKKAAKIFEGAKTIYILK